METKVDEFRDNESGNARISGPSSTNGNEAVMKEMTARMQQNESSVKKVTKNPKKQAAGRAGAAARKANKERLLKELQTAKKDLRKQDIVEKTEISKTTSPQKTNQPNSFGISIPVCVISAGLVSAGIYIITYRKISLSKNTIQKVVVQQPKSTSVKTRQF